MCFFNAGIFKLSCCFFTLIPDVALNRNQRTQNTVKKEKRQTILLVCRFLSE